MGGEQGWRSGESARLPPMWRRFNSRTQRHMWVEFVVSSRPTLRVFSLGTPVFPPSSKTNISKFQFNLEFEGHRFVSHTRLSIITLAKQSRFIFILFISQIFYNNLYIDNGMPTFSTPSTQKSLCRMLEGKKKHATAVAHTQKKNSLNQGVKVVLYVRSKNTFILPSDFKT